MTKKTHSLHSRVAYFQILFRITANTENNHCTTYMTVIYWIAIFR